MRNIILDPNGKTRPIEGGNIYRSLRYMFEESPQLLVEKAEMSVQDGKYVDDLEFILRKGYAIFTEKDNLLPEYGLNGVQSIFVRAYLHTFSEAQQQFLIENSIVTVEQVADKSIQYYEDILNDISGQFQKIISETFGNIHDFNRDTTSTKYYINQLRDTVKTEEGEERRKAISRYTTQVSIYLIHLYRFSQSEVNPIRIHERLIRLEEKERLGKIYSYEKKYMEYIRQYLGMEDEINEV